MLASDASTLPTAAHRVGFAYFDGGNLRTAVMVTVLRSSTVSSPPAARTVAATPPGMFSAVSSVFGSPMARIRYGGCSSGAVDLHLAGSPVNAVSVPTRTRAELDRLGAGAAQLLDHVEQLLPVDLARPGR